MSKQQILSLLVSQKFTVKITIYTGAKRSHYCKERWDICELNNLHRLVYTPYQWQINNHNGKIWLVEPKHPKNVFCATLWIQIDKPLKFLNKAMFTLICILSKFTKNRQWLTIMSKLTIILWCWARSVLMQNDTTIDSTSESNKFL